MPARRAPSIAPPSQSYPRAELEEMVERWLQANISSEREGDWSKHLSVMYTQDAVYSWNVGPDQDFVANGRKEIHDVAIGYQMKGFEGWEYPYHDIIIDDKRGMVIGFWRQVSPLKRKDGSPIAIEGIGGSWFQYGGNYQWKWQRDFFDMGNAKDCFFQLAGAGALSPIVKEKIHRMAKGEMLPGHVKLHPDLSLWEKTRNAFAIVKIAIAGK